MSVASTNSMMSLRTISRNCSMYENGNNVDMAGGIGRLAEPDGITKIRNVSLLGDGWLTAGWADLKVIICKGCDDEGR